MNEHCFQEQFERVDRLLEVVAAPDPSGFTGRLRYEDILVFAFQSMWHLKDWILNDARFGAADVDLLAREIHSAPCLQVCADIANASKHLTLTRPKTSAHISERSGIDLNTSKGLFRVLYYVESTPGDRYHGVEVRDLLLECRDAWQQLIAKHHLSDADNWLNGGT